MNRGKLFSTLLAGAMLLGLTGCRYFNDKYTKTTDTFPEADVLTEDGEAAYKCTCRIYGEDGELQGITESLHDAHGNPLREYYIDVSTGEKRDSGWNHRYEYDESGNILLECDFLNDSIKTVNKYKYNADGTQAYCVTYSSDAEEKLVKDDYHVYEYDDRGNVTKETFFDKQGQWGDITVSYQCEYDDDGRILTRTNRTSGGSDYVTTYTYDSEGNMISEKTESYDEHNSSPYSRKECKYDTDGRLVCERTRPNPQGWDVYYYEYDDHDRLLRKTNDFEFYDNSKSYDNSKTNRISEYEYEYEDYQ
ncbi:MAG: hypothetical protein IKW87_12460 [Ruminococcus sp.]|nr:hypothetical protein [Ruminococcus sp.]